VKILDSGSAGTSALLPCPIKIKRGEEEQICGSLFLRQKSQKKRNCCLLHTKVVVAVGGHGAQRQFYPSVQLRKSTTSLNFLKPQTPRTYLAALLRKKGEQAKGKEAK
jgi:hypothetical protein